MSLPSEKAPSPLPLFAGIAVVAASIGGYSCFFNTPGRAADSIAAPPVAQTTAEPVRVASRDEDDDEAEPVAATAETKVRWIRAGLSTKGSSIVLWSRGSMTVTDGGQAGRKLAVKAGESVTFYAGGNTSVKAKNRTFTGTITVRTDAGDFKAWRMPRVTTGGSPTHVSSNGASPRYQRAYRGHFEIAPLGHTFERATHLGKLRLVNIVPLESYLRGVVPWEMNASAPLEALKAQAICARSETMHKIGNGRHSADGYQICDYDHCQGYAGTENENSRTDAAVAQTSGLVMYHNGQIADAVYGTNSGGITAASEDVWAGGGEAYLRSRRDFPSNSNAAKVVKSRMTEADWVKYCTTNLQSYGQPSSGEIRALASRRANSARTAALFKAGDLPEFYRWSRVISPFDLAKALSVRFRVPMDYIGAIQVRQRAASGHIKSIVFHGYQLKDGRAVNGRSVSLEGDSKIRAMLSGRLGSTTALPSSTFVVQPRLDSNKRLTAWVLRGAGWGHGVGMCQRGAQNRARAGWKARQIIEFYYNDVDVRELP